MIAPIYIALTLLKYIINNYTVFPLFLILIFAFRNSPLTAVLYVCQL